MFKKFKSFKIKKNKYSRFLAGTFFILFFSVSLVILPKVVKAIADIHGSAWWGNDLKFIYFNCEDYEFGSHFDSPENFRDLPEPRGFHFYIAGCVIDHGVKIANDGNLFGAAFNHSKGMINFGGSSTPVNLTTEQYNSFNSNCLNACNAENFCSACYNSLDQKIYGYAQASSTSELIRLDVNLGLPSENDLQLKSWNLSSSTNPYYSTVEPGDFVGHASSTVAGLHQSISFNCLSEYGSEGLALCNELDKEDYKVYIKNPEIGQMTAPNWSYESACSSPGNAKQAVLKWSLNSVGSFISGYEIAVTRTDIPATSSPDTICYSGFKLGSATQYTIPNALDTLCTTTNDLDYNEDYYWFIRLYYLENSVHTPTEWYQFGANDGHQGELYDIDNGPSSITNKAKTFSTYKHEFPTPYFTWSPPEIEVGATTTIFTALTPSNESRYYTDVSPSTSIICDENGVNCQYLWSVIGNVSDISSPTTATTTITFHEAGNADVNLRVEDSSGYYCIATRQILDINYGLPIWREVKAE
ncbi:hypothetical protein GW758_00180 [Candidatus Falkowbacteria bacterium]|nr:hypothetical protein [Candidatus Falkowbacteria bacterium]NCT54362.1 hypothetical protein [Candidatus Falkowbacteria bacterium]